MLQQSAVLCPPGHFRTIRCGEQRSKQRLGLIKPMLVNAAQAFDAVKTKSYAVR